MLFLRYLATPLLLMLFSLLSCSSDGAYPYTILKGDPYNTRVYTLPGGAKLYIARVADRPRVAAALCMHFLSSDTLEACYSESVYSPEYPLLFARIGSEVSSVVDCDGSVVVCNNIPSNELENWSALMQGTFAVLSDTLSLALFGDVVYDEAVATLSRYFAASQASCNDDTRAFLPHLREEYYAASDDAQRLVSLSQARPDAKNSIRLLESPPAKVAFPDCDELKIKNSAGQPKMVVAASDDSLFTFAVRACLKELPASFLVSLKEYFDSSLDCVKDSAASDCRVRIEKNSRIVEFTLCGRADNMRESVSGALSKWKSVADPDKFYKYLLANSRAVTVAKKDYENIAIQSSAYAAGGERLCGIREMAKYSMDALFAPSSELLFYGKNSDEACSLFLNSMNSVASAPLADFSAVGDSLPRYLLLPVDADSVTTVTLAAPYASVEDFAMMALFNKAALLSHKKPSTLFYPCGALLSVGARVPFTSAAFEAAKSFLLYECSTQGSDGHSLLGEYASSCERGYTSSQLYDALMHLSLSDVESFYNHHVAASAMQVIVACESNLDLHSLAARGRVVHLTYDELFGY